MSHVCDLIMEDLATALTTYCITNEADADAKARVVKVGLYQGSQDDDQIIVTVHENNPFERDVETNWYHEVDEERRFFGLYTPWRRRFTIRVICNFTAAGHNQDRARELFHQVLMNVENCLDQTNLTSGPDSKGERIANAEKPLMWNWVNEGGGVENELLWRMVLGIEYLTETR